MARDTRLVGGYAEAVTRERSPLGSSSLARPGVCRRTAQRKRQLGGDCTSTLAAKPNRVEELRRALTRPPMETPVMRR